MKQKNLFNLIFLPTKAYDLFDKLDGVRGQADISGYEQNVCEQYAQFITHALTEYDLPIKVSMFDKASLNLGLRQYEKLLDLITLVDKGLQKGLNFTKLQLNQPQQAIGENGFDQWINTATSMVKSLPSANILLGSEACTSVGRILFGRNDNRFTPPDKLYNEIYSWCMYTMSSDLSFNERLTFFPVVNKLSQERKDFFNELLEAEDPYESDIIFTVAEEFADEYIKRHPRSIIAVEDVITECLEVFKDALSAAYEAESKKHAKKTASFWTGFGIWAVLMAAFAAFLFLRHPIFLPITEWVDNGFWGNVGIVLLCLVIFFVAGILFVALFSNGSIRDFFARAPVFPRGASAMLCCYLVFASGYPEMVGDYKIPFYVFGIACIIASLFYEFLDAFRGGDDSSIPMAEKWRSPLRGAVMFTTPLTILPPAMILGFLWLIPSLHIVAAWIIMIAAIVVLMLMVMSAISLEEVY